MRFWQQILRTNFTKWDALADFLELTESQRSQILPNSRFVLNMPLRLATKAAKGTLHDPIVRQFLPLNQESEAAIGFTADPVADTSFQCTPGLLQKYQGRVLIITTGACAMHCRYCFRQNFEYNVPDKTFALELAQIEHSTDINEVILSGGDPLSLPNPVLKELLSRLSAMPHIRKIRFHTRFPMGIPERIDAEFLEILQNTSAQIWFVIHANHAAEFDQDIWDALRAIRSTGAIIMNQSVLLKGVNDSVETLRDLCLALVDHGVVPYYLHQLDRVRGAAHFEVPEAEGLQLIAQLQALLPGYAVPRYMREIPGATSKTQIS